MENSMIPLVVTVGLIMIAFVFGVIIERKIENHK